MTAASHRRRYAPRWASATGAGPVILGGMAYQVMTGRFVGRADELARLRELLAHTAGGEPLVALVSGEAGVGKTRLADQVAATAAVHRLGLD
jgi:MoxR-like ATPase